MTSPVDYLNNPRETLTGPEQFRREQAAKETVRHALGKPAGANNTLPNTIRHRINEDMARAGLDGNGNFRGPGHGVATAFDVLHPYGISVQTMVSGHDVATKNGRITIPVGYPVADMFMPPIEIVNSVLVMTWHQRESGNYEIVAYMS